MNVKKTILWSVVAITIAAGGYLVVKKIMDGKARADAEKLKKEELRLNLRKKLLNSRWSIKHLAERYLLQKAVTEKIQWKSSML